MRKSIVTSEVGREAVTGEWLDLESCARAELSSEEPVHPIELALQGGEEQGWRAAGPGEQTVSFLFDRGVHITRLLLVFREEEEARTQEFLLRWSADGSSYRDIVRQQFNFTPPHTTREVEEYNVDLSGVRGLELKIVPDVRGGTARASLAQLRIAGTVR